MTYRASCGVPSSTDLPTQTEFVVQNTWARSVRHHRLYFNQLRSCGVKQQDVAEQTRGQAECARVCVRLCKPHSTTLCPPRTVGMQKSSQRQRDRCSAAKIPSSAVWCEGLQSFQPVCFECSHVAPASTKLSFVVVAKDCTPAFGGPLASNISICEDVICNSPQIFKNFLFFFFCCGCQPS